jgi:hypothetical protein
MKVYIYTVPKAGTYFLADFVERLGFKNTGFHVSKSSFLNTKQLDLKRNSEFPGVVVKFQGFMKTLQNIADDEIAFGHFPVPLISWAFKDFRFIGAYRHPRRTLVSEFIDFRFRRKDIDWLSHQAINSDQDAFSEYLERHGSIHMSIFSELIAVSMLYNDELVTSYQPDRIHFLNFDSLLNSPGEAENLARYLGKDAQAGINALTATLAAETKTKATNIDIDREALWSVRAEAAYQALRAEEYVRRGRELGWSL